MKYAVYVEGQSELLFVTDVLQKYSGYDPERCGFLCITLSADDFERMSFPQQGGEDSENYYQIVNVNNDNLVVSKLKKDIPGLISNGYNVLIGLKDVFGKAYEQMMDGEPQVDRAAIEEMHKAQFGAIGAPEGSDCRLHYVQACGEDYSKHGSESFSFLSMLTVEDYEGLRNLGRCASFSKFLDSLLGGTTPTLP